MVIRCADLSTDNKNHKFLITIFSYIQPRTGHEGPEGEQMFGSTLSLTTALDSVGGPSDAPVALPRERESVPLVKEAMWAPIMV